MEFKGSKPRCLPRFTAIRSHYKRCVFLLRSRVNRLPLLVARWEGPPHNTRLSMCRSLFLPSGRPRRCLPLIAFCWQIATMDPAARLCGSVSGGRARPCENLRRRGAWGLPISLRARRGLNHLHQKQRWQDPDVGHLLRRPL